MNNQVNIKLKIGQESTESSSSSSSTSYTSNAFTQVTTLTEEAPAPAPGCSEYERGFVNFFKAYEKRLKLSGKSKAICDKEDCTEKIKNIAFMTYCLSKKFEKQINSVDTFLIIAHINLQPGGVTRSMISYHLTSEKGSEITQPTILFRLINIKLEYAYRLINMTHLTLISIAHFNHVIRSTKNAHLIIQNLTILWTI